MIWGLLGLVLVLVLIGLAFTNSNAGRVLPLALIVVIGIIGYLAWYQNHELSLSEQRIPVAAVELADMKIIEERRGKQIAGRVRNHSQEYTLTELQVRISMKDCVDKRCEVINQTDITLKPDVPPGQARTSPLNIQGKLELNYTVVSTRGE